MADVASTIRGSPLTPGELVAAAGPAGAGRVWIVRPSARDRAAGWSWPDG